MLIYIIHIYLLLHRIKTLGAYINNSFFRFIGVGVVSELLYLVLFSIGLRIGLNSNSSVLLAGISCIVSNSYLHARISFKTKYHIVFLLCYLFIQIVCMASAYFTSLFLISFAIDPYQIGIITMILWAFTSYILCLIFLKRIKYY